MAWARLAAFRAERLYQTTVDGGAADNADPSGMAIVTGHIRARQ
jgi:hypothetical protein